MLLSSVAVAAVVVVVAIAVAVVVVVAVALINKPKMIHQVAHATKEKEILNERSTASLDNFSVV